MPILGSFLAFQIFSIPPPTASPIKGTLSTLGSGMFRRISVLSYPPSSGWLTVIVASYIFFYVH